MRQVTITDVHTRLRGLSSTQSNRNYVLAESAQSIIQSRNVNSVKSFIEKCAGLKDQIPMQVYCDLFESIIPIGTKSDICNIGNYIAENMIHKVRSAEEYAPVFKSRMTRWKNKLKSPIDVEDFSINIPIPTTPSAPKDDIPEENIQAATEAFSKMLDKCEIYAECDRLLNNYNTISKRFNLDKVFIENGRRSVSEIVVDLCEKVDTYSITNDIKFCTVIETAWYGFENYNIPYEKSDILESAINYFLFKPDGLTACRNILETTLFFDKEKDMKNIDILMEEEPEENNDVDINETIMQTMSTHTSSIIEGTD